MFRAIVFTFVPTAIELVLVAVVLARSFSPMVAGLVIATFVAYVSWTTLMTQAATDIRKQVNVLDNQTTGKAVDALLNFETVALFNNQALEVSEYDTVLSKLQKASIKTEGISATLNAGQSVILSFGLTAVLAVAAMGSATTAMTAGDLVLVQGLLLQLWGPLQFLGWFYRELRQSLVDLDAFLKVLQTQNSLPDGDRELPALDVDTLEHHFQQSGNGPEAHSTNGAEAQAVADASVRGLRVELKDVHFSYNPEREVLKGVNITAEPGQSVAIVGPSGSGKSTLLRLMVRLYDATSGSISLNGADVRDLRQGSLRGSVAVVPQDTVLFNDTIYRNIAYGRIGATREEVEAAAQRAQLDSAIARMSDGYNTMVGERGLKLSGGEKQRVAIARAFLRSPKLLICDEATSALDTATERGIMDSLTELASGRTSIFVAHRLSTIRSCDKIVVMSAGQVVEEGSHQDLMNAGRVYADMWAMQAEQEEQSQNVCIAPESWEAWEACNNAAGSTSSIA
jgi:ABC-type transport system involved in Fe-S cluster assembly fused permease/ATPase subunit